VHGLSLVVDRRLFLVAETDRAGVAQVVFQSPQSAFLRFFVVFGFSPGWIPYICIIILSKEEEHSKQKVLSCSALQIRRHRFCDPQQLHVVDSNIPDASVID
jgi:hypothetical protein